MVKSRGVRWAGHVALMDEIGNAYNFGLENRKGRYHLEDPDVNGKIILEWILEK
jgi:hypothetical protein